MKRTLGYVFFLCFHIGLAQAKYGCFDHHSSTSAFHIKLLKDMFKSVVEQKNAALISQYYHPEFLLYANGKTMNYQDFLTFHEKIYQTPIQYTIKFDENTLIEHDKKVAGRMFITTHKPTEKAHEIEVILIAEFKNNKIYRMWELTYPDWSTMPRFQSINP